MGRALELIRRLETNVGRALVGKPEVVRLAVIGLVARGHLLIEDVPGVGKTTLAAALARSIGAGFQRIQFTSDMLPSDILGVSVWQPERSAFVFKPGPLFTNIVLADEINRTTPKTQSSLLEAMNETQVSLDHSTYQLPRPFMVLATQNPLEYEGTHALPESQLDRFLLRITIVYPGASAEQAILLGGGATPTEALGPLLAAAFLLLLLGRVVSVRVAALLRALRPRRTIRPTRDGWWCLGAAVGLGFAAMNTGNNLLYLLASLLLGLIIVSGILSEQSMRRLRLAAVVPDEIYAGRAAV